MIFIEHYLFSDLLLLAFDYHTHAEVGDLDAFLGGNEYVLRVEVVPDDPMRDEVLENLSQLDADGIY